jgi:ferredoxin-NADP reductase
MPWKWYDSTVVRIEEESPTTKRFWVELPDDAGLEFKAGQFVTMDLPIHEKRLKRWRSYSIANAPNGNRQLEFCIVKLEGGAGSTYFFEDVQEGTPIRFKGPAGTFTLPESIDHDLVFICTGTGVAPFRSMLWDIYNRQLPHKKLHLIFGTRYADGILYQKEMEELQEKLPGFTFEVALSREKQINTDQFTFPVHSGYVHPIYEAQYPATRPDVHFYLCGWSNMIDDAVAKLVVDLGYDKSQVHYELYG